MLLYEKSGTFKMNVKEEKGFLQPTRLPLITTNRAIYHNQGIMRYIKSHTVPIATTNMAFNQVNPWVVK